MAITLWLIAGLIALVIGAELLVRGASRIAVALGVPALIIGLTVVAFGTSAPEMAVSVSSAFSGKADLALGNVVGSNILNVLFILGISALIVPLVVNQQLVRFDVPLMLGISILVYCFSWDGIITSLEGGVLFAGMISYTVWCIRTGQQESPEVQQEYERSLGIEADSGPSAKSVSISPKGTLWQIVLILVGLSLLVTGANWLVFAATQLAKSFGMSDLFIGLTIVAGGTSLPEAATSIIAAWRGERDIAVGNIVGSNIFNILGVLGLTALIAPQGVAVATQAFQFDIPVMIVVSAACLPIFFSGHQISRWEGGVFLFFGFAYVTTLLLVGSQSEVLPMLPLMFVGFLMPISIGSL